MSEEIAASVVTKESVVPMLIWIMPLPLAMPPMVTVLPPITVCTAHSFLTVSVVMIASAALVPPSLERMSFSSLTPLSIGASGSG